MRPHIGATSRRLRRWCLVLLLMTAWSGQPALLLAQAHAAPPTSNASSDLHELADRMNRTFAALEEAARQIPTDTFDPRGIVKQVGDDPQKLCDWVRSNTRWMPYQGALRGSSGVLMDRIGDDLDRALLLAELLRDSKHEVRLARATLSLDQASQRISALRQDGSAPSTQPSPTEPNDKWLEQLCKTHHLDVKAVQQTMESKRLQGQQTAENVVERTAEQTPQLLAALKMPESPATAASSDDTLIEAARDHWWVQVRQQGQWQDLDPASSPGSAMASAALTFPVAGDGDVQLPSDLYHQVQLQITIEMWHAGRLVEKPVLTHTLRPMEVLSQHIELQFVPMNWPQQKPDAAIDQRQGQQRLVQAVMAQHQWMPQLRIGDDVLTQSTFTSTGQINNADLAQLAAGWGFESAGSRVGGMLGGGRIGNAGAGRAHPSDVGEERAGGDHLTAVWLDYTIQSPGRSPIKVRRQVMDVLGPAARATGGAVNLTEPKFDDSMRLQRGLALLTRTRILPLGCTLSSDYCTYLSVKRLLDSRDVMLRLMRDASQKPGSLDDLETEMAQIQPLPGALYTLAMARGQWSRQQGQAELYLDAPNVLSEHTWVTRGADGTLASCTSFDIVSNDLAVAPAAAERAFALRVEQGILDTNIESALVPVCGAAPEPNDNPAALMSRTPPSSWCVVRTSDDPQWKAAKVSDDIRARIDRDLADHCIVMVPISGDSAGSCWWRVDSSTGQTVGIDSHGWGAASAERNLMIARISVKIISGVVCAYLAAREPAARGGPTAYDQLTYELNHHTGARITLCVMSTFMGSTGLAMGGVEGGCISLADDIFKFLAIGVSQGWFDPIAGRF